MAVRLYLDTGKIKEYSTYYGINSGGESGITTYTTKCGMTWDKDPGPYGDCNHLDCAIYAAEDAASGGVSATVFLLVIVFAGLSSAHMDLWDGLIGLFFAIFFAILCILIIHGTVKSSQESRELKEFRDKGTVNGIRARQL